LHFALKYSLVAKRQLEELSANRTLEPRFKAVKKALRLIGENPAYPSLQTHKYGSLEGPEGVEVFEAYAENNTPSAYRIFWCYYPAKTNTITILLITPHP
jgi:hypothetical protein